MSKLSIKGHPTRGNEVIEILEMLGGENLLSQGGWGKGIYLIDHRDSIIYYTLPKDIIYDLTIFTLEEFLEKFPYKVGDKVFAFGNKCTIIGTVWDGSIKEVVYTIKLDTSKYTTTKLSYQLQPYKEETMEELRIDFPEGYGYAGIENKQVIFTKIKPQYPKTYEECCNILKYSGNYYISLASKIDDRLFEAFYELKVCRDAYWKIAGEQMGLGKPWEPDTCQVVHSIARYANEVVRHNDTYGGLFILEFPTKEMRDAFCENFKELIEQCKELL